MNVLLCIGCNVYPVLGALHGAEKDATDVFNLLLREGEEYSRTSSQLLLSPTDSEVRNALKAAFPNGKEIEVVTFFFAGHAGIKAGSFYLCSRDSDPNRFSTTAFPIIDLFTMVNEFHPKQVNIVVDACESGGSSFDLNQLLKPEIVGSSEATRITFLGACSSDQLAGETQNGGNLTRELIRCLTGDQQIQTKWPFLDLIEIGGIVSKKVHEKHPQQKPITWALNFFGDGQFARNPHFGLVGVEPDFPVGSEFTQTKVGRQIQLKSSALWNESRAIKEVFDPRRLLDLLKNVFRAVDGDGTDAIPFLRVLANTFSAQARESAELLAPQQCLATCALFLLPHIQSENAKAYARDALREVMAADLKIWQELLASINTDELALCNNIDPMAELYYLPLRITKTLGWIGLGIVVGKLLPELADGNDAVRFELASRILERYESSFVAVSDAQAPFLYVFLKACLLKDKTELAERVAHLYFGSFAEKSGNVTRVETDGGTALTYMRTLGPIEHQPTDWRPANPSCLLSVLLLFGYKLGLNANWNLRALDRKSFGLYIPDNYLGFSEKIMEQGMNYTNRIGFGIWNVSEFNKEFERGMKASFPSNISNLPKEGAALCTVASLLFPDRLPLLLERAF